MTEMNRRAFAESVLAAALLPVLGHGIPALPAEWWPSNETGPPGIAGAADLDALVEALTAAVRAQYGDRLGADDLAAVSRQIRNALGRAEQMRAVELANGDEPDFVFTAPASPG